MKSRQSSGRHQSSKSALGNALRSHKTKCRCACTRSHYANKTKDDINAADVSSPVRGRSTTPKFDRTNGDGKLIEAQQMTTAMNASYPTTAYSVEGEEGLATYQMEGVTRMEVDDPASHANESIQRWLNQRDISGHRHGISHSPEASMFVESSSTMAPSLASSGCLPPSMASPSDLLPFTTGGFDEGTDAERQRCAFTPLWLTHEQRYCRKMHLGAGIEAGTGYSPEIDMSGVE